MKTTKPTTQNHSFHQPLHICRFGTNCWNRDCTKRHPRETKRDREILDGLGFLGKIHNVSNSENRVDSNFFREGPLEYTLGPVESLDSTKKDSKGFVGKIESSPTNAPPTEYIGNNLLTLDSDGFFINQEALPMQKAALNRDDRLKSCNNPMPLELRLGQWNAWSINGESKINFTRSLDVDILLLQEVWQRSSELENLGGTILDSKLRQNERGGGTASLKKGSQTITCIKKIDLSKDMKAIKLRINHNYFLWVVNFYNHDGSTSRFQKIIGKLRKSISPNEWKIICIIGDFNTDINEDNNNFKLIKSLSKQMGLKVWNPNGVTRKTKRLDYLIAGEHISSSRHNILPSPSDHKAILWDIQLQSIKPPSPISIPSKEWAIKATETAMLNPKTIDSQSF